MFRKKEARRYKNFRSDRAVRVVKRRLNIYLPAAASRKGLRPDGLADRSHTYNQQIRLAAIHLQHTATKAFTTPDCTVHLGNTGQTEETSNC